ncbi:MAG: hypothetical protein WKF78_04085 [Candidatus Limnocylindrales bacterium]
MRAARRAASARDREARVTRRRQPAEAMRGTVEVSIFCSNRVAAASIFWRCSARRRRRLLGRGIQALQLEDPPVPDDRHQHFVVVDPQVVDPGLGDLGGLADEARDAGARHLEGEDLVHDRAHGGRRLDLERRAQDVPVEDHVQVLVGGDPDHDLVRDRVVRVAAGVAVGDPGRELLERRRRPGRGACPASRGRSPAGAGSSVRAPA